MSPVPPLQLEHEIRSLNLQPGDIVTVTIPGPIRAERIEAVAEQLKPAFPDIKIVVMEQGTSLSVGDDQLRRKVDDLAAEFERRSKEAHDYRPDTVAQMARFNAVWGSYRDAAYELRTTFGVPFGVVDKAREQTDDQLEEGPA